MFKFLGGFLEGEGGEISLDNNNNKKKIMQTYRGGELKSYDEWQLQTPGALFGCRFYLAIN